MSWKQWLAVIIIAYLFITAPDMMANLLTQAMHSLSVLTSSLNGTVHP